MRRKTVCRMLIHAGAIALCWMVSGMGTSAFAESVFVSNASFEEPAVAPGNYSIFANSSAPDVWVDFESGSGVFNNAGAVFGNEITNQDGSQLGFTSNLTNRNIFQDMTATYEIGKSYELTVGFAGRSDSPGGADDTIDLRMFTRTPDFAVLGSTSIRYGDLSNTQLTDYTLSIPTVQSTDSWAGQPMGIWMIVTSGDGGAWTLDNVRLEATTVPEPASLTLLGCALAGLAVYARRRR